MKRIRKGAFGAVLISAGTIFAFLTMVNRSSSSAFHGNDWFFDDDAYRRKCLLRKGRHLDGWNFGRSSASSTGLRLYRARWHAKSRQNYFSRSRRKPDQRCTGRQLRRYDPASGRRIFHAEWRPDVSIEELRFQSLDHDPDQRGKFRAAAGAHQDQSKLRRSRDFERTPDLFRPE